MSTSPPLLLVGHGTRSDAGVAEFTRFVGQVRAHASVAAGPMADKEQGRTSAH